MTQEQFDGYLTDLADGWPGAERAFLADSLLDSTDPLVLDWIYGIALQTPLDVGLRVVREQSKLDMRSAVRGLRVPVRAVYSTFDPYYPVSLGEEIAASAPDGSLVVLDQSAHCAPIEEPARFAAVVEDFAAGRPPA
jgi:pimeloyl-ACP methyl ester carboxylesterase